MTNIELMLYFLSIEVKQVDDEIFISQERYAKEILKKFKMKNCKPISTPLDCGVKLFKNDSGCSVNPTLFKSFVRSLRSLTCTRPGILYRVGLISRYMEDPKSSHFKETSFNLYATLIAIGEVTWTIEKAPLDLHFLWEIHCFHMVIKETTDRHYFHL